MANSPKQPTTNPEEILSAFKAAISTADNTYVAAGLFDSVEDTKLKINTLVQDSKPIKDSYSNFLTATGTSDKVASFTSYGFSNDTLNYPLWLALYNDSWVFRKAIDKPAEDCVNAGFTIHVDDENIDLKKIYKVYGRHKQELINILRWGSLFGGSIGVMMFDNLSDEDYSKPINKEKIKGRRMRIYVTDRWYGCSQSTDTVSNMKDMDFGKPMSYDVFFGNGHTFKVHHSYILRYEHRTAPNLIKNGQLQGWGYAEGSHILNELSRDDQLKSAITSLVNKSLIEIIKMAGMRGVFMGADKGNEEQLKKRLEMVNWGRNFNSLTFLDKDDEYSQHELGSLSGLSNLLETNMWLVAAAVDMPGILFGDLKGGLATESDALRRYAITIKNRCESYYRSVLQKLLQVIYLILGYDITPNFDFNSLIEDELNSERMDSISKYAGTISSLIQMGIVSKYQAALSMQDFINNKIVNITFTEEQLSKLKYEEEAEILQTLKTRAKYGLDKPSDILQSQFGGNPSDEILPEKLEYLNEARGLKPEAAAESAESGIQEKQTLEEAPTEEVIPNE